MFKCLRGQLHNFIQKFILQTSVNFLKGILKNIIRCLLIFFCTFPLAVNKYGLSSARKQFSQFFFCQAKLLAYIYSYFAY